MYIVLFIYLLIVFMENLEKLSFCRHCICHASVPSPRKWNWLGKSQCLPTTCDL